MRVYLNLSGYDKLISPGRTMIMVALSYSSIWFFVALGLALSTQVFFCPMSKTMS